MTNNKFFSDLSGTSLARYAPMVSEQNSIYPYATGVGVVIVRYRLIMSSYFLSKVHKVNMEKAKIEQVETGRHLEYLDRTGTSFSCFVQERIILISCPGKYLHLAEPKQSLLGNSRYRSKNLVTIS